MSLDFYKICENFSKIKKCMTQKTQFGAPPEDCGKDIHANYVFRPKFFINMILE